ncbi:MAG: tRNA threonylcarbamoyladenosine dehydratase [Clostridiales bacterium]|jgi:tRNA A37 threonylcarbamoyladenosine dehydratase|nr:tRNA threonylcarbamoyladenosine dehydratase [Clostridiales bacterium]
MTDKSDNTPGASGGSGLFIRSAPLLGAGVGRLQNAAVLVFGAGGVGGYCLEILARSGVGRVDIVDRDVFEKSNLNRQLLATGDVLGKSKALAAAQRLKAIDPAIQSTAYALFYLPETADRIDLTAYSYCVDAIDTVTGKLTVIERCQKAGVPVISCMGTGNRVDPTAFRVGDIGEVRGCPLGKVMRRELKKRGIDGLKTVYSTETPRLKSKGPPASVAFCPAAAGILLGWTVVKELAGL